MECIKKSQLLRGLLSLALIFSSSSVFATTPRVVLLDALTSADGTKTRTLPQRTGTAMLSASMVQETPSGTVNGSNVTFTLSATPAVAATLTCHEDGLLITLTTDYTRSGATLTMVTAPATGQIIVCQYSID